MVPRGCRVNAARRGVQFAVSTRRRPRVDNDSKLATTSQEGMARATAQTTQEAEKR